MAIQAQYQNNLVSSYLLYLNNKLIKQGAFTNYTGNFYPTSTTVNGYYNYQCGFSQLVSDFSNSSATIGTGIYINSTFVTAGTSGFVGYNYDKGLALFTTGVGNSTLSGVFSVKQFPIVLMAVPETKLLFETKFSLRPKTLQQATATGLNNDQSSYPGILARVQNSLNTPWAFGGLRNTSVDIGLFVLTDSLFSLDALNGVLTDSYDDVIPYFESTEKPYNALGGYSSGYTNFNYDVYTSGRISSGRCPYVKSVEIHAFKRGLFQELQSLNPEVFHSICDFVIDCPRITR